MAVENSGFVKRNYTFTFSGINEIISTAILELILKIRDESTIRDYWIDTINANKETIEPGSVSDTVAFILREKIGLDYIGDIDQMHSKIRSIMRGGLQ